MELFDPAGHLTDGALLALAHEEVPDELARLEMAEHLAYCDQCLHRYTALLAEAPLLTPAHSCRESLWRHIRARAARLFLNRYAAAAAAVTLALGPKILAVALLGCSVVRLLSSTFRSFLYFQF